MNKKKVFLNVVMYITFAIAMYAGWIGYNLQSSISIENNRVKTVIKKNPLEIKGELYFVTNEQLYFYEKSDDVFIVGCLALLVMIYLKKKL